jgi:hypothetical protein
MFPRSIYIAAVEVTRFSLYGARHAVYDLGRGLTDSLIPRVNVRFPRIRLNIPRRVYNVRRFLRRLLPRIVRI